MMRHKRNSCRKSSKFRTFIKAVVLSAGLALLPTNCAHKQKVPAERKTTPTVSTKEFETKKSKLKMNATHFSGLVSKGSKFAVNNYNVTVKCLNEYEVFLLASTIGHNIEWSVYYGESRLDWPKFGFVKTEKGAKPGTARLAVKTVENPSEQASEYEYQKGEYIFNRQPHYPDAIRVMKGTEIEKYNSRMTVMGVNKFGVILLAKLPGRNLLFQVPYGESKDYPGINVVKSCIRDMAWLSFSPKASELLNPEKR
jgi:hypothetical protein